MASDILFTGTYTKSSSKGIYAFLFNRSTAQLTPMPPPLESENPTFLTVTEKRILYTSHERGENGGLVSAYEIGIDGDLTLLNSRPSGVSSPCHVSVTPDGSAVFSSNYRDGLINTYPVEDDGRLGAGTAIQFEGSGPDPVRQTSPHAHSVTVDTTGTIAVAADLGTDRLMLYRIEAGTLHPLPTPFLSVTPGAGPRHVAFSRNGRHMYLMNEMSGSVIGYRIPAPGVFEFIEECSALPSDFCGEPSGADIHMHPSGRYLYCSNRNHDSITIFAVAEDGRLCTLGHEPVRGRHPRNFMITPDGSFLLVANMQSDAIEGFTIRGSGMLTHIGRLAEVPMPTCLQILTENG